MQNENQAISKNSQTLPSKQSNSYLNFRTKTLTKYVTNKEESNLVIAFENKYALCEIDTKDCMSKLIDVLAKWRWMSGINSYNQDENEVAKELYLIAQFVLKNYPKITIDEIELAIDLSLTDKLDTDVRTFNTFSPMYVSRILNAYIDYKMELAREIIERKNLEESKKELEVVVTPKEKMEGFIELFRYFYDKYKTEGVVNDYFSSVYHYLRRTNNFTPNKQMIDDAMNYAKAQTSDFVNKHYQDVLFTKEKPKKEDIEKRFARDYCVMRFFDSINVEEFISKIQISDFHV